jgi:hypothetical protein
VTEPEPPAPTPSAPVTGGARGCRDQVAAALTFELPRKVLLLRQAWNVDENYLPDVQQVVSGEVADGTLTTIASTWVIVVTPKQRSQVRVDIDAAGRPVYMTRYGAQIFVWVKATRWDYVLGARDDTTDAVRRCLIEWPNLTPGQRGDSGYRIYENTLSVEYGIPVRMANAGGRLWCGSVLSLDIDVEETLADGSTREPIGTVATVGVTGTVVGPDQPLPGE